MTKQTRALVKLFAATVAFLPVSLPAVAAATSPQETAETQNLVREVRHQLVLLPYYSVFDNLAFKIDGSKVTLIGQVVRPTLKSDAEGVVKRIEGVSAIQNDIEVLPLSPNDDRIRRTLYRSIYSYPALSRYGYQAVPSIHIIVKNGNVTLEGVVDNQADKNAAGIRANTVSGVFSVTNNLRIENGSK